MTRSIFTANQHPTIAFANFAIKDRRTSVASSFLLLFAIMEGVVSFVLPIVDAFGPLKHIQHKFYLEIFRLLQFTVSILALAYLQAIISYYERWFGDRKIHIEENKTPNKSQSNAPQDESTNFKGEESQSDFIVVDTSAGVSDLGIKNLACRCATKQRFSGTRGPNNRFECRHSKENRKKSPPSTPEVEQHPSLRITEAVLGNKGDSSSDESQSRANRPEALELLLKRGVTTIGKMLGHRMNMDKRCNPPFTRSRKGNSLYLRLGAVVFGFGVIIMDGFRVADQFDSWNAALSCHSVFWIPVNVIHSIYTFWQTYFLFKYHHVAFNVQKFLVRFILAHMTVVNLGQWMGTVVQEVMVSDREEGGSPRFLATPNISTGTASIDSSSLNSTVSFYSQCRTQVSVFAHYLIPCGVEYSLIACAIFYKMFRRVGHVTASGIALQCSNFPSASHEEIRSACAHPPSHRGDHAECQHAHKGLFAGLLLVMATLVALALFHTYIQRDGHGEALTVFQVTDITLLSIGILAVSVALFQLRVLGVRQLPGDCAFDDDLLLIGLLGILFYNMFLLVPAVEGKAIKKIAGIMFVSKSILEIIQALMQVFLILEASRSQASNVRHVIEKPGRTVLTFLLILNLAMWIVTTFGLKHAEGYSIHRAHYSGIAWKIITHLSMPLIVFFRFHSTICIADIWSNAYRIRKPTVI
ncbi:Proton channel OtopLc [Taenia crassiceps]|uniref:Proton channel OtopLc n=1 Tax=Taenia crassiceps TaxID=6207 RepID=A0ABR4QB58_9CEST